jgi:peptidoglycan/LPS O-acetylase OafA/YrhL
MSNSTEIKAKPNVIPQLDGLRAFAALLVVFSHTEKVGLPTVFPSLTGGFGVMLFFMLSGFLMGYLYLQKPIDRPAIGHYISARVARIAPIYLLSVTLAYIASYLIGTQFIYYIDTRSFLRLLAFSGSNHVFWSIPPEIQFYFTFLVFWYLLQTNRIIKALPFVILTAGVILMVRPIFPGISIPSHFHIFFLGVALSVLVRNGTTSRISPSFAALVQVISLAALFSASLRIYPSKAFIASIDWDDNAVFYGSVGAVICFGAFLLASTVHNRFGALVFANPFMRQIAKYSFSLYLLHEPVMAGTMNVLDEFGISRFVQIPIAVTLSLGVAALSFHLFESKMQDLLRVPLARLISALMPKARNTLAVKKQL